jgi:hypothetical protein
MSRVLRRRGLTVSVLVLMGCWTPRWTRSDRINDYIPGCENLPTVSSACDCPPSPVRDEFCPLVSGDAGSPHEAPVCSAVTRKGRMTGSPHPGVGSQIAELDRPCKWGDE